VIKKNIIRDFWKHYNSECPFNSQKQSYSHFHFSNFALVSFLEKYIP